ncbi:MAG: cytochrome c oxidase subunit 3 [Vicingaceae bacterium]
MIEATLDKKEYQEYKRKRVSKPLLVMGMLSIVMLFAGLTSAVIVRKGDGNWLQFELPEMFLWSTLVIAVSSISMIWANYAAKKDNKAAIKSAVSLTMILGIAFIVMQLLGYGKLIDAGIFFTGPSQNASGSYLYIISWMHLLHLVGGMIALGVVLFNAFREKYSSKNLLGLQVCSMYWHFMGGIWIYLYIFFRTVI